MGAIETMMIDCAYAQIGRSVTFRHMLTSD